MIYLLIRAAPYSLSLVKLLKIAPLVLISIIHWLVLVTFFFYQVSFVMTG